jgi:hypothetical protein
MACGGDPPRGAGASKGRAWVAKFKMSSAGTNSRPGPLTASLSLPVFSRAVRRRLLRWLGSSSFGDVGLGDDGGRRCREHVVQAPSPSSSSSPISIATDQTTPVLFACASSSHLRSSLSLGLEASWPIRNHLLYTHWNVSFVPPSRVRVQNRSLDVKSRSARRPASVLLQDNSDSNASRVQTTQLSALESGTIMSGFPLRLSDDAGVVAIIDRHRYFRLAISE